ncbi:hypothetical protein [Leptospira licerasiae]|uniref:Lipoprotein n=1 Tax=Leptospira licerasiae str. MMD4847 TaxID=1049971 RepID=A0ABN0H3P1_9LEPT|nr:hypothetical protein [Leptospira licerasiae]EIE00612.1 hypothetical protein LEP1GSC185_0323 [Leptospira licerasiae serovar Varillal str. VAR 010]EJZ40202.1 putative lipoprotein [Leptospira licerasiae str. MMD4847]
MNKFPPILSLCFLAGCINLSGLNEYRGGWVPKEFHQNFLKFKIQNYKERKNYEPNRFFYKVNQYYFVIKWLDPDVYFPYTEKDRIPRSINPPENYYRGKNDGLSRNQINQFLHGDRRDYFAYDCEYWMPLLPGKNQYKIFINDEIDGRREGAELEFDLPEGNSVRMKIVPLMRTLASDPIHMPIGERSKNPELIRKGFEVEFTIEKNRPGEQEPVCDLGIEP